MRVSGVSTCAAGKPNMVKNIYGVDFTLDPLDASWSTAWMPRERAQAIVQQLETAGYEASEAYDSEQRQSCVYITFRTI